ncbi:uncharacterized protein SEPMUDRAFT_117057 [Sphaerulina musiva SO2202]|uniref:Carboxymuconolactone decarboxylase-like domain-containing protein n=1 Tax=Sphaerulina musiva (strain SO2202) TaxID=692275 RepID=M3D3J4_SPHMS|nr:uncharacterized protein SEPMUDRAFT_117057 [Sphaerulina musiva SO2202]EMF12469.1 hypothetical protein SEPMUDRAFT_117057 [Sphaerulina musiva SO2202]
MAENKLFEILAKFTKREDGVDHAARSMSLNIMVVSLAAACAGGEVVKLYRHVCEGLPLDEQKLVQRRIKEALIKTGHLYGTPKVIQALFPLFQDLKDEEIDQYGPRYSSINSSFPTAPFQPPQRALAATEFFANLWGNPSTAQKNLEYNLKYCPDLHFLVTMNLTWLVSEPEIFTAPETCMLNGSAMICSRSGRQAYWHVRGVVRQGGTKEQAQLAQELALEIAGLYGVDVGGVVQWEDFEWEGREGHV